MEFLGDAVTFGFLCGQGAAGAGGTFGLQPVAGEDGGFGEQDGGGDGDSMVLNVVISSATSP